MNIWSQETYLKASRFAAQAHRGQLVPGTELPYLLHLSMVSMEVIAALQGDARFDGELALQCAWLHDTLEDTAISYATLAQEFSPQIADGVSALTKDSRLAKPLQMTDSLRRIKLQPPEVAMVKLADRITNLQRPPAHWTKAKTGQYRDEALEIYHALKDANAFLAARLLAKIEAYAVFVEDQK
ncbi:MAG: HD domain-containing protein [Chloroflexaceae bacterium]|jgi:(p)ppGpp synthase/HD superfamily hydrolase|nr:HD domain-containing protein [Chloroflexaceae bacterium]